MMQHCLTLQYKQFYHFIMHLDTHKPVLYFNSRNVHAFSRYIYSAQKLKHVTICYVHLWNNCELKKQNYSNIVDCKSLHSPKLPLLQYIKLDS